MASFLANHFLSPGSIRPVELRHERFENRPFREWTVESAEVSKQDNCLGMRPQGVPVGLPWALPRGGNWAKDAEIPGVFSTFFKCAIFVIAAVILGTPLAYSLCQPRCAGKCPGRGNFHPGLHAV